MSCGQLIIGRLVETYKLGELLRTLSLAVLIWCLGHCFRFWTIWGHSCSTVSKKRSRNTSLHTSRFSPHPLKILQIMRTIKLWPPMLYLHVSCVLLAASLDGYTGGYCRISLCCNRRRYSWSIVCRGGEWLVCTEIMNRYMSWCERVHACSCQDVIPPLPSIWSVALLSSKQSPISHK